MLKRIISLVIVLIMIATTTIIAPSAITQNSPPDSNNVSAKNSDLTVTGESSLGNMFAAEYNETTTEDLTEISNKIIDVEVKDNIAYVSVQSLTDARLVVGIYDELGRTMYASGIADVTPENEIVEVVIEADDMPKYFIATAYLIDRVTNIPLCEEYKCDTYTKTMQEFFSKSVDDFEEERVLTFDDEDDYNFMVYNEDTVLINNTGDNNIITDANEQDNIYIIENIDESISSLVEGDIFAYEYDDENVLILKISSIFIEGTTATIYGEEVDLEDVFEYIRIDVTSDMSDATVDDSDLGDDIVYEGTVPANQKPDIASTGAGEMSSSTNIKNTDTAEYTVKYKEGENYISGSIKGKFKAHTECYFESESITSLHFRFTLDYDITISADFHISLVEKKFTIGDIGMRPMPGLYVGFRPVIRIRGSVNANISGNLIGRVGFSFINGKKANECTSPQFTPSIKVKASLYIGLDMQPFVKVVEGWVVEAKVNVTTGFTINGEIGYSTTIGGDSPAEIHKCNACLKGDVYFDIDLSVTLKAVKCKKLTWTLNIYKDKFKLLDFYWSMDQGKGGFTVCPNKLYKQVVTVIDGSTLRPLDNSIVNGEKTDSNGRIVMYLNHGTNKLTAQRTPYITKTVSTHVDKAGSITIRMFTDNIDEDLFAGNIINKHRYLSPYDYYEYRGHYYKLFDSVCATWENAAKYCINLGGHLATIGSAGENRALYKYTTETDYLNAYFGFTDNAKEGQWNWITGERNKYQNWTEGEPNDEMGGEDYAMFYWKFTDGKWNDGNFGKGTDQDQKVFLCEWESKSSYNAGLQKLLKEKSSLSSTKNDIANTGAVTKGTVTQTGLVANSKATMFIVEGTSDTYAIDPSTILYVSQTNVDENGEANFTYYGDFSNKSWVSFVYGDCAHENCTWKITTPSTIYKEGLAVYECDRCFEVLQSEPTPIISTYKTSDKIRIYFMNNQNWTDVSVHYWGDTNSIWPGVQMTTTGTYKNGYEIFTAVVPKTTTGLVFNGNAGKVQTVDLTNNIKDNQGWSISSTTNSLGYHYINYFTMSESYTDHESNLLGDFNNDEVISIMDTTEIQLHIANILEELDDNQMFRGDTDFDGYINITDATQIQRFLARFIEEF